MRRTPILAALSILAFAFMHFAVPASLKGDEPQGWKTIERQFLTLPMESRRYTGPLFWLHGDESPEVLEKYLEKVAEGGLGCFTAESRPHNDWLGEGWYRDLEICLQAAKQLDLKMWIFDERWWPSGEVGGKVPQQYGSKYLQVAGINFHIPHSFNPRAPFDRDCPPYFYNNGFEPRWPLFRIYADYTSRLTHLLTARPPRLTPSLKPARTPLKVERLPNAVQQTKVPVVKKEEDQRLDMVGCFWVWYPGDGNAMNAPPGTRCFRHVFTIPAERTIKEAKMRLTADNSHTLFVNGNQVESGGSFQILNVADLKKELRAGPNVLAVVASNGADYPNPAGVIGRYFVELDNGDRIAGCIDTSWKCTATESPGWKEADFDDGTWVAARNVAPYGAAPWGKIDGLKMLTLSPVKADPFVGQFTISDDWRSDSLRIYLETKTITPENAAAVHVNGQFVGGFIGKPNRLDITDQAKTGLNQLKIEPFAPSDVRIVAYSGSTKKKRLRASAEAPGVAARLSVQLDLNRDVYSKTRYKHPPQFAVWIESPETSEVRTLYVTQKLGRGSWNGKPTVPVSLPYWVSRHNKQTATMGDPTREHPLADAITQPTPTSQFNVTTMLPKSSQWQCFVEVNVSGDFNDAFPASRTDGTKDRYGNGQPSLVYRATVKADPGNNASFRLLGRTSQWKPLPKIEGNLEGITTAKKLFTRMQITVDVR